MLIFGCAKKDVPKYSISRVVKSDTASLLTVNISNRLNETQLLSIASQIKSDSSKLPNLQLCYLLTGHKDKNTSDNNFYAIAKYPNTDRVTMQDTLKDADGNVVRLKITGISAQIAKHLLELNPKEITGKNIVGRFIDDNNQTVIVPFYEPNDPKKELYVMELDTAGKVVSATVPMIVTKDGMERYLVSHRGDYITLKDSILTQYSIDDAGLPYNSIKAGL